MAEYEYKTHIRYNDINENNELSEKGLLNILSEAAGKHSQEVGYGINNLEETGYLWMLLFWKVKINKRPHWNTELTVKTWPRKFEKVSSWRDFEVYDESGEKVAIATTNWVLVDARTQGIARITEKMANEYGMVQKSVFDEEITGKIAVEDNMKKIYEYTSKRRDIDVNHHVNNVNYLEFAFDAFPEGSNIKFDNIEIQYKRQIKLGETVSCFYAEKENVHTVCIKSKDEKTLHATLKFF